MSNLTHVRLKREDGLFIFKIPVSSANNVLYPLKMDW